MRILARIGRLFPRNSHVEAVQTAMRLEAAPETVWQGIMLYEEVPRRPAPLLRLLLPLPVRTEGDKTRVGARVRCVYEGGYLEKRITAAEAARALRFDVTVQRLGIEDCVSMRDGSYEIGPTGAGSELVLTTRYCGHLRPRWLWRPLESYLARRVHRHILDAMRSMRAAAPANGPSGEVDSRPSRELVLDKLVDRPLDFVP